MSDFIKGMGLVAFMYFCGTMGWLIAHGEIATECQRQGSFYVGKFDFTCAEKKKEPSQ